MKNRIQFSKEQKDIMVRDIKMYFIEERQEDIGELAAIILLDYITQHIGPMFYNQGIKDAIAFMGEKVEDMYGLEM